MAKPSMERCFRAALERRGFVRVKETGKYGVYKHADNPLFYYVGSAGGLRAGVNVAKSVPVNSKDKSTFLSEGEAIIKARPREVK